MPLVEDQTATSTFKGTPTKAESTKLKNTDFIKCRWSGDQTAASTFTGTPTKVEIFVEKDFDKM